MPNPNEEDSVDKPKASGKPEEGRKPSDPSVAGLNILEKIAVTLSDKVGSVYASLLVLLIILVIACYNLKNSFATKLDPLLFFVLFFVVACFLFSLAALTIWSGTIVKTRNTEAQKRQAAENAIKGQEKTVTRLKSALESRTGRPIWTRLVPKVPLSQEGIKLLREQLCAMQLKAWTHINNSFKISVKTEYVRCNIFLLDTSAPQCGGVGQLHIPDPLYVNMSDAKEREIRFLPGEGLTGRVFCEQQPMGAQYNNASWGSPIPAVIGQTLRSVKEFKLTEEQTAIIDPKLRWIVSFPLVVADGKTGTVAGILNIDGLDHQLSIDQMKLLSGCFATETLLVSSIIGNQPLTRVSIWIEEIRENDHGTNESENVRV